MTGPGPAGGGRAARYRTRRLPVGDGETLVLRGDGTIERLDAAGATTQRWLPEDPAWPAVALRFGVRTAPETVVPRGRDVPGSRPPA